MSDISHGRCEICGQPEYACRCEGEPGYCSGCGMQLSLDDIENGRDEHPGLCFGCYVESQERTADE